MPEMRQDPVTKQWTIIATERAKRPVMPDGLIMNKEVEYSEKCFFCLGNEKTTPDEVLAFGRETGTNIPGWTVRVVPNKFAALNLDNHFKVCEDDLCQVSSYAAGTAEVVIETTHHSRSLSRLSVEQVEIVLKSYRERYKAIAEVEQIQYILMFRNHGAQAGASISHPHSQIIAVPVVPNNIKEKLTGAKKYFEQQGECVYSNIVAREIDEKVRIIEENDLFLSYSPFHARTPFETHIIPKYQTSRFEDLPDNYLKPLAEIWKRTLQRLDLGLVDPPYNYYIHTAPTNEDCEPYFRWHVEIIPKLTIIAGFELGTGMFINISIPEDCSSFLREVPLEMYVT